MCKALDPIFAKYISDNYVDDLIDYDQVKLVFLVESPHTQEVKNKIPLFGSSGSNLSAALNLGIFDFKGVTYGFGKWLSEQHLLNQYKHIGIMNVSNIRLDNQLSNDEDLNKYINVLKFIKDSCTRTNAKYVKGNLTSVNIITQLSNLTNSSKTKDKLEIYNLINDIKNNKDMYQQILNGLKIKFYYRLERIRNHDCCFVVLGNFANNFFYKFRGNTQHIITVHPSGKNLDNVDKEVQSRIHSALINAKCINIKDFFELK